MATQLLLKSQVEHQKSAASYLHSLASWSTSSYVNMYKPRAARSTSMSAPSHSMVCVDCFQAKGESELRIPCQNPHCCFYLQTPLPSKTVSPTRRTASVSEVNASYDSGWSLFGPRGSQPHSTTHTNPLSAAKCNPQLPLPVTSSDKIWGHPVPHPGLLYSNSVPLQEATQKKRSQSTCFDKEEDRIKSSRPIRSRLLSLQMPEVLDQPEYGDLVEDAFASSSLLRGEDVKPQRLTPDTDIDSGINSPYSIYDWSDQPKSYMTTNSITGNTATVMSQSDGRCFDMSLLKAELPSATNYRSPRSSVESPCGMDTLKKFLHAGGFTNLLSSNGTFSRKVFVGGLPPDIDDEDIKNIFVCFGSLIVDWPHKLQTKACVPPKGYAFLLFKEESSVLSLLHACFSEEDKYFIYIPSGTQTKKKVQVRPWLVSDSLWYTDPLPVLDSRKAVFVGGVPRPLKAAELAQVMQEKYGSVVLVAIDCDSDLKYPKGAACVVFSSHPSYIAAVSARFMQLNYGSLDKKVEIKPYVLDGQMCDECHGVQCNGKPAPFFCGNVACLQYFCEYCWASVHSMPGRQNHRPLQKDIGDKSRYF